jgi:hypothetical protein
VAATRREIRHSPDFLAAAREHFPVGGSAVGKPSFELFSRGPLEAASELFSRSFEELFEIVPGIRALDTIHTPFFPPITFYAALVDDYVEILSMSIDDTYWDLLDGDPEF